LSKIKLFSFQQWSLQARVSVLVALPLVCIIFLTIYNINSALNRETANLQDHGEELLLLAAGAAQLALFAGDEASLNNLGDAIMRDSQIAEVLFFDEAKNQLSSRSANGDPFILSQRKVNGATSYVEGDYWYFIKAVQHSDIVFDENPEQYAETPSSELLGWVVLAVDLTETRDYRAAVMRNNVLIGALMLSLALWLAFRFSRAVVQPINLITSAVGRYGLEDFDHRVEEVSGGELGDLEQGINKLAERVGQSQAILREEVEKATDQWMKAAKGLEDQNVDLAVAKERAEEANDAKDDFLARMSHELRTPLTGIIGFVRLLSKTEQPKTRQEYSDMILASASVLLSTINDILDFSKLRANSFSLNPVRFNLADCLRDVLGQHRIKAFEKSIELNILVDSDVPVEVFADIDKLQKVVNNIISNAVKFTPSGDIVMFVSVAEKQGEEANIIVSVKDSGTGISSADISRLFNPFFQSDESSTRSHGGTGLGLSIAEDFVTLMGGGITVDSVEGEGTEVEFNFHCRIATDVNARAAPNGPWRATLFDINPWTRRSWRNQLLKLCSDVRAPTTENDLLDSLKSEGKVDILVLGFNAYSDSLEVFKSLVTGIRSAYGGVIILAVADDGSISHQLTNELYGPLIVVSKPLTDLRGTFDKAEAELGPRFVPTAKNRLNLQARTLNTPYLLEGTEVLVAEDNLFNQQLLATVLEAAGAIVILASNGEEALRRCEGNRFDVLVLDLHMPKLDGLQLSKCVRNGTGVNVNTPIIVLTADVFHQESTIMAAGVNAICYKPIDEEALIKKVHSLSGVANVQAPLVERALISLSPERIEEEVNGQLLSIRSALESRDLVALQKQTHQLLGVIGLSGIDSINSLAQQLHKAVLSGDFAAVNVQFESLSSFWSKIEV
jgi:two-component system sensor histidine kinase BarA